MSRGQLQKYLAEGSQNGKSLMTAAKTLKRKCDTAVASVASLKAKGDAESTNTKGVRRSVGKGAVALRSRKNSQRKVSPPRLPDPETIDFDAEVPLEDATVVAAPADLDVVDPTIVNTAIPTTVVASAANTEALNNLVMQLENEQAEKKRLSEEIEELTAITKENQKIIAEKFGLGDSKMVAQGQRYLLNSATNVMTHPDNAFGKHLYHGL